MLYCHTCVESATFPWMSWWVQDIPLKSGMEPNIVSTDTLTIVGFHDVPCQILEGKSMIWTRVFDRKPHFVKLYHAKWQAEGKRRRKKAKGKESRGTRTSCSWNWLFRAPPHISVEPFDFLSGGSWIPFFNNARGRVLRIFGLCQGSLEVAMQSDYMLYF